MYTLAMKKFLFLLMAVASLSGAAYAGRVDYPRTVQQTYVDANCSTHVVEIRVWPNGDSEILSDIIVAEGNCGNE
jgi:hypothetical protein